MVSEGSGMASRAWISLVMESTLVMAEMVGAVAVEGAGIGMSASRGVGIVSFCQAGGLEAAPLPDGAGRVACLWG